jgi:hypothetical protein
MEFEVVKIGLQQDGIFGLKGHGEVNRSQFAYSKRPKIFVNVTNWSLTNSKNIFP